MVKHRAPFQILLCRSLGMLRGWLVYQIGCGGWGRYSFAHVNVAVLPVFTPYDLEVWWLWIRELSPERENEKVADAKTIGRGVSIKRRSVRTAAGMDHTCDRSYGALSTVPLLDTSKCCLRDSKCDDTSSRR
jgi:hypothetical protein